MGYSLVQGIDNVQDLDNINESPYLEKNWYIRQSKTREGARKRDNDLIMNADAYMAAS